MVLLKDRGPQKIIIMNNKKIFYCGVDSVSAYTKSEARAEMKKRLGIKNGRLPVGTRLTKGPKANTS